MLSYDIAVPFLMASFVMTSSAITTTSGENNDPRLVRKIKNSKKQGYNNLPGPCLPAGGTFNGISEDAFFRTHKRITHVFNLMTTLPTVGPSPTINQISTVLNGLMQHVPQTVTLGITFRPNM